VHRQFSESIVLARAFCTVPFDELPPHRRRFVEELAEKAGVASSLRPVTPVLSLIGTHGTEPDWCVSGKSRGHLGIPLISATFVDAIPMISGLLKELGIPLDWADTYDTAMIEKTLGRTAGLFFVEDARRATDQHGRKIISSQEFVASHGIRSVLGTGGGYVGGQIVILMLFCRDSFPRTAAECFMALIALFKRKTADLVGSGRVFSF
jgi:hypothetical protein